MPIPQVLHLVQLLFNYSFFRFIILLITISTITKLQLFVLLIQQWELKAQLHVSNHFEKAWRVVDCGTSLPLVARLDGKLF